MPVVLRRVLVLTTLFALSLLAMPALAQTGPYPLSGSITCDRSVTSPGSAVVCTADGFKPASVVDVVASGQTVDRAGTVSFAAGTWEFTTTVTADAIGTATATIQVPSDAVGPVSVTFSGTAPNNTDRTLRSIGAFTVVATTAGGGVTGGDVDGAADGGDVTDNGVVGGVLSSTGGPFVLGGIAVLALMAIGSLLLLVGRKNRVRV